MAKSCARSLDTLGRNVNNLLAPTVALHTVTLLHAFEYIIFEAVMNKGALPGS
jgi:hypothetical protein